MFWPFVPMIIWGVTVVIPAFLTFDQLAKHQYANFHDQWMQDGKPSGFFWRAPGGSYSSRNRVCSRWGYHVAPDWIRSDDRARDLFKRLQVLNLVALAGIPFVLAASGLLAVLNMIFGII